MSERVPQEQGVDPAFVCPTHGEVPSSEVGYDSQPTYPAVHEIPGCGAFLSPGGVDEGGREPMLTDVCDTSGNIAEGYETFGPVACGPSPDVADPSNLDDLETALFLRGCDEAGVDAITAFVADPLPGWRVTREGAAPQGSDVDALRVALSPGEADSLRTAAANLLTREEREERTKPLSSWRALRYRELTSADEKLRAALEASPAGSGAEPEEGK